jgi:hypothetical protein
MMTSCESGFGAGPIQAMRRASSDAKMSDERTLKWAVDRRPQKANSLEVLLIIRPKDLGGIQIGIRSPNFYIDSDTWPN